MERGTIMNWKDIFVRAGKTFVQAFVSALIVSLTGVNLFATADQENFWLGVLMSAGAAGVSAAWNIISGAISVNKEK
jgi:hypothetical protein